MTRSRDVRHLTGIWFVIVYIAAILTAAFVLTALQPGGPF